MATLTLTTPPYDTYSGRIDFHGGHVTFDTGSATLSELNDPRSPQPLGARLRQVIAAINDVLGTPGLRIDGQTVSKYMMANYGQQAFDS